MFKDFARLMTSSAPEQADVQLLHSGHQLPTSRRDRIYCLKARRKPGRTNIKQSSHSFNLSDAVAQVPVAEGRLTAISAWSVRGIRSINNPVRARSPNA